MARATSKTPRRSPISFLQALLALVTAIALFLAYGVVDAEVGKGWVRTFALEMLPGASLLASAYALSYFLFFRQGLTRDQQLADAVGDRVAERLGQGSSAVELVTEPARPDWEAAFRDADHLFVAARSLARWSSSLPGTLEAFLSGGGTIAVVAHDPRNETNLSRAAAHHGSYSTPDPTRVRGNVLSGLGRLRAAAASASPRGIEALDVRLVDHDEFVFTQAIFAFYRGGALQKVLVRPHENVRGAVTRGPMYVVDATRDAGFRGYVEREIANLNELAREPDDEDLRVLFGDEAVRDGE